MLVLTRKVGERIHIGDSISLTVVRIQGDKIRIGIEAPDDVQILREEVRARIEMESPEASGPATKGARGGRGESAHGCRCCRDGFGRFEGRPPIDVCRPSDSRSREGWLRSGGRSIPEFSALGRDPEGCGVEPRPQ